MKLRRFSKYMNSIKLPAYIMLKATLIISILMMAASLVLVLIFYFTEADTYMDLAKQLFVLPQSVLLIGGLFSAIIEDMS